VAILFSSTPRGDAAGTAPPVTSSTWNVESALVDHYAIADVSVVGVSDDPRRQEDRRATLEDPHEEKEGWEVENREKGNSIIFTLDS
jgi:hypothetical protein